MMLFWLTLMNAATAAGEVRPPVPIRLERWFRAEDYPESALSEGIAGTVHYELSVGADGAIIDCRVIASSGSALLDATACAVTLSRGRFEPALDESGRPIASRFRRKTNWVVPDRPERTTEPVADVVATVDRLPKGKRADVVLFQLEAAGEPGRGCAIHESSGSEQLDRAACEIAASTRFSAADTKPDAEPAPVVVYRRIRFELDPNVRPDSRSR